MGLLYLWYSRPRTGLLGGERLRTDIAGEQSEGRGLGCETSPFASLRLLFGNLTFLNQSLHHYHGRVSDISLWLDWL